MKRFIKELTKQELEKILNSDLTDWEMYFGYKIITHLDTSLELCNIYTIEGDTELFDDFREAREKAKRLFIKSVEDNPNRYKGRAWCIAHIDRNADELAFYYEGGLNGIGQNMGYTATGNIENALWFETLDDLCAFLKSYCYNDGAIIKEVSFNFLYEKITGKYIF